MGILQRTVIDNLNIVYLDRYTIILVHELSKYQFILKFKLITAILLLNL